MIALVLALGSLAAAAKPPEADIEKLLAAGEVAPLVDYARAGGDILPVVEHFVTGLGDAPPPKKLGALAQIYYARSQHVASFSEGQSEALLTIACLLRRQALGGDPFAVPMPDLENAEDELDKKLNRFKTSGIELVKRGEGWSFHNGDVFPDDAWAASDFDDTFWAVENAPFGYGDDHVDTETKAGPLYLRRYFEVEDSAKVETLRATVHGNAVVSPIYLNGKEQRFGEFTPGDLVEGSNTIAVLVYPPSRGRSDFRRVSHLSFDFEFTANLPSAEHHLATVDDSTLGLAIGKFWGALPAQLRETLISKKPSTDSP